jgi:hypothetical protein
MLGEIRYRLRALLRRGAMDRRTGHGAERSPRASHRQARRRRYAARRRRAPGANRHGRLLSAESGATAFAVVRRTGELGVRMGLGASPASVLRTVLRDALSLVVIGLSVGLPVAVVGGRLASHTLSGLLLGLTATDPPTLAVATLVLVAVTAVAAYLPAARAARIDPITSLRQEG